MASSAASPQPRPMSLRTWVSITFPSRSMVAWTITTPSLRSLRAISGYAGSVLTRGTGPTTFGEMRIGASAGGSSRGGATTTSGGTLPGMPVSVPSGFPPTTALGSSLTADGSTGLAGSLGTLAICTSGWRTTGCSGLVGVAPLPPGCPRAGGGAGAAKMMGTYGSGTSFTAQSWPTMTKPSAMAWMARAAGSVANFRFTSRLGFDAIRVVSNMATSFRPCSLLLVFGHPQRRNRNRVGCR